MKRDTRLLNLNSFGATGSCIIQPCTGMIEFSFLLGIVFMMRCINVINES